MNRITPEMVKGAYEKTGLKPMRGVYFPEKGCACGLGAMYAAADEKFDSDVYDHFMKILSEDYHDGFATGFDGDAAKPDGSGDFKQGYEDGKAAWEAVKENAYADNTK